MKKSQKGFIVPIIILIIAVLGIGVAYTYKNNEKKTEIDTNVIPQTQVNSSYQSNNSSSTTIKTDVTFSISDNTLSVINKGKITQTIALDSDAIVALNVSGTLDKFIINQDVNFDGYNDVGVFTSTGYAGVNNYYDYYLFNPQTGILDKSLVLVGISNASLDNGKKEIKSSYRSGPQWYTDTFRFNGSTFIKVYERVSN